MAVSCHVAAFHEHLFGAAFSKLPSLASFRRCDRSDAVRTLPPLPAIGGHPVVGRNRRSWSAKTTRLHHDDPDDGQDRHRWDFPLR